MCVCVCVDSIDKPKKHTYFGVEEMYYPFHPHQ